MLKTKGNHWLSYKGDLLKIPQKVQGYDELIDAYQSIFSGFLYNFYQAWEHPEEHTPISVIFTKDKANGEYLRVNFEGDEWYHVKDKHTWY